MATYPPSIGTFTRLQDAWKDAAEVRRVYRANLDERYQAYQYAKVSERKRLARLQAREDTASNRFLAWLEQHSPRSWVTVVPLSFVRDTLTYADARTAGQLDVIPPPAYGYSTEDSKRFAWPMSFGPHRGVRS